jgi:hypothetical protein
MGTRSLELEIDTGSIQDCEGLRLNRSMIDTKDVTRGWHMHLLFNKEGLRGKVERRITWHQTWFVSTPYIHIATSEPCRHALLSLYSKMTPCTIDDFVCLVVCFLFVHWAPGRKIGGEPIHKEDIPSMICQGRDDIVRINGRTRKCQRTRLSTTFNEVGTRKVCRGEVSLNVR